MLYIYLFSKSFNLQDRILYLLYCTVYELNRNLPKPVTECTVVVATTELNLYMGKSIRVNLMTKWSRWVN